MHSAPLFLMLLGCQDYNLNGSSDAGGKYNPPDLGAQVQTDRITQVTIPAVDVLFVIDNSCSMEEEQRALRENFGSFMQYFIGSGLDYHVGVVSTDMEDRQHRGQLMLDESRSSRYIDDTVSERDALLSFQQRANLGTGGSGTEAGLDASMTALTTQRYESNVGYYRDDASLSVVVISDEPDQSDVSVNEYVNWITGLKTDDDYTVLFSAIVGPDRTTCRDAERGAGYIEVTSQLDGILWPICDADYSSVLEELGLRAAGLKQEFFLSLVPVEATLSVQVEGGDGTLTSFEAGSDWSYSRTRNSVTFAEFVPLPLSVVQIQYEVLAASQGIEPGDTASTEDTGAD